MPSRILLLISILLFATYPTLSKIILRENSPMMVTMLTGLLSGVILLLLYGVLPEIKKFIRHKQLDVYLILVAFLSGALAPTIRLIGLAHSSVLNLVIISSFQIPITVLMSHWFLKEKLTRGYMAGIVVLLLGLIIYSTQCFQVPFQLVPADALLWLSSFVYAVGDILYKKKLTHVPHEMVLITRNLFGSMILLVAITLLSLETDMRLTLSQDTLISLGLIILLPIIVAQSLWYKAMEKVKESEAILLDSLYAVFSGVIAFFILREQIAWYQLVGGGVILIGVIISHVHFPKHKLHRDAMHLQQVKTQ